MYKIPTMNSMFKSEKLKAFPVTSGKDKDAYSHCSILHRCSIDGAIRQEK
jgi:hypothetical protein